MKPLYRWNVTITYRTERGPMEVDHAVMEFEEIHDLIEQGPSFEAIECVVVTYAFGVSTKTIEQTEAE